MKRYTHYILLIEICLFTTLFAACVNEDIIVFSEKKCLDLIGYDDWSSLKDIAAVPEKTEVIKVKATNVAWRFTGLKDNWITLSPMSGHGDAEVQVTIAENTDLEPRKATWTLSADDYNFSRSISLTQKSACYVKLEKSIIHVNASATTDFIKVSTNAPWTAKRYVNWVTFTTTASSISLRIEKNTSSKERRTFIYLYCGDAQESIFVWQDGAT